MSTKHQAATLIYKAYDSALKPIYPQRLTYDSGHWMLNRFNGQLNMKLTRAKKHQDYGK
jgi:hypothetical protein